MVHFQKDKTVVNDNIIIFHKNDRGIVCDSEAKGEFSNNIIANGDKVYKQHYDLVFANTFFKRLIFGLKLIFSFPQRVKYNLAKIEA